MKEEEKLKPVIFIKGNFNSYNSADLFKQNLILKAFTITSDPKKIKELIGVRTIAEVYRTLDKMAIRKEYHEALARKGIDLDTIISGIKNEADNAEESVVRLNAWKTLLKSLGLDEYKENSEDSNRNWEDVMRKMVENRKIKSNDNEDYDVIEPPIPEEEKEAIKKEKRIGQGLYE